MSTKRKLKDSNIVDNDQPKRKLRKIKADEKKATKLRNWKAIHLKCLQDLLQNGDGWKFSLPQDDIMKLRGERNGRMIDLDFVKKTIRPNRNSTDKTWLSNFTKQSMSLTSKRGICIAEFSHSNSYMFSMPNKESLKLFYLNILEHVSDIKLFRKTKPTGIKKAKWKKVTDQ
eukprot:497616_1